MNYQMLVIVTNECPSSHLCYSMVQSIFLKRTGSDKLVFWYVFWEVQTYSLVCL